jgi:hypothetical protein
LRLVEGRRTALSSSFVLPPKTKQGMIIVMEPTYYIVRSLRLMNFLVRQGHDVKKVQDANDSDILKVFLFHDSPLLQRDIKEHIRLGV